MNGNTYLWRQIRPAWVSDDRVTAEAFIPLPKDEGFLSFCDGDQISAEQAWVRHTKRYASKGVVAVTVNECSQLAVLPAPDPVDGMPDHVSVDFNGLTSDACIEFVAAKLARIANARGWQYNPQGLPSLVPSSSC